jgi:penicillin-binding protein 2
VRYIASNERFIDHYKKRIMTVAYKIRYTIIGLLITLVFIVARLCHLQILLNQRYVIQGQRNFLRTYSVPAPRGNIVDRNGVLLATNRPVFSLYWRGTGHYTLSAAHRTLIKTIETILEKDISSETLRAIAHAERRKKIALIEADLSFSQLSKVEEQCASEHASIEIRTSFQRHYPHGNLASHVIGYIGMQDGIVMGRTGLEKVADEALKGTDGIIQRTINSFGAILEEKELQKPVAGSCVKLTIHSTLQRLCQEAFPAQRAGAFLVMDPEDGALLALVSCPDFNPALFLNPISTHQWHALQETKPFLNRALHAAYPPGSSFKLITVSAALENNITTPDSLWHCKGYVPFGKRKYWCSKRSGHGIITTQQGLALSCNTLFYELAKQMHIDTIADYAHRFGLGRQTGIILSEHEGLVPSSHWKATFKGEPWWPGETLSVVIGQSFLLTTPVQIARFISSIFTGYLTRPRLLWDDQIEREPLAIKQETLEFLQQSMKSVVTTGTGRRVNKIADLEIYAKTSTAQTSNSLKTENAFLEHSWFVGYCRYKDYKPITFVIVIEYAGSSRVATDVAKNFLMAYRQYMDQSTVLR